MYCDIGFHTDLTLGRSALMFKHLKNVKFNNPIAICDNGNMSQLVKCLSMNKMNIPAVELFVVKSYKEKRRPSNTIKFYAFDELGYNSLCKNIYTANCHKYYSPRIIVEDIILEGNIIMIVDNEFLFLEDLPFDKTFVAINEGSDPSDKVYLDYNPIFYYDSYALNEKDLEIVSSLSERKFKHYGNVWYYDNSHYAVASLIPDAITNYSNLLTRHKAAIVNFVDRYPVFRDDADELFDALVETGFYRKCPQTSQYRERIDFEKSIIKKMKYENYFLVNWDLINWARHNDIPIGPGRGSAAGSLIAYCLDITKLDPVANGLYFERFLNPERISPPDIDTDVDSEDRHKVVSYLKNKYGNEYVSKIITFSELKSKSALKDAARLFEVSAEEINIITAQFPPPVFGEAPTLEEALEITAVRAWSEKHPKVWKEAENLEGFIRQTSIHAAGIVIAPTPLSGMVGVTMTDEGEVCQFDMSDAEKFGLLKLDLLGLKTLRLIKSTLSQVGLSYYAMESIPLDDPKVIHQFALGNTHGIFQFESDNMRKLLIRVAPTTFADIAAVTALYRPGPLMSGLTESYIENKHSDDPHYFLPEFKELLAETYGVFVYQEQVMKVAQVIAGFSLSRADTLRKAIGKKNKEMMTLLETEFLAGSSSKGYDPKKISELWKQILKFADYCFNKSHSYAYSMLSYWSMYLKVHHPSEFVASRLTSTMKNTSDLRKDFHEFKPIVKIYDPCINQASESFVLPSYDSGGVMIGLGAIKGMGSVAEGIVKHRPFSSMADFLKRVKLDKTQLTCLIYAGAFDVFEKDKAVLLGNMERILKFSKTPHSDVIDLFDPGEVFKLNRALLGKVPDPGKMEMACYGFNIKYGFINENRWMVDNLEPNHVVGTVTEIKRTKTKKDKRDMAIVSLDTSKGLIKALLFYDTYKQYNSLLLEEKTYAFTGQLKTDPEPSLFVSRMSEEWNIKVTRANLISDSFDKDVFDIIVNEAEKGDAILSVSSSERFIMNHNKKINYNEQVHTKLMNAGFVVNLEIFEARMIE